MLCCLCVFFFSSRRRHTRLQGDWSSDVCSSDLQEAAQRAEQQRFDVVFVGMRMPEQGGLELARRIRSSPQNRDAAIVMLSTTEDILSLRKAFGEGADFVLTKPVTASRLRPMLNAMESPTWKGRRHAPP